MRHPRHLRSFPSVGEDIVAAVDVGVMEEGQLLVAKMIADFYESNQIHHRVRSPFFRTCQRTAFEGSRNPAFQRSLNAGRTLNKWPSLLDGFRIKLRWVKTVLCLQSSGIAPLTFQPLDLATEGCLEEST